MRLRCTASCNGSSAISRCAVRSASSVAAPRQRADPDPPRRCPERVLRRSRAALVREQRGQALERELLEPFALDHEPLLEQRAAERETFEEVSAVELDGPGAGRCLARPGQMLEAGDVDV